MRHARPPILRFAPFVPPPPPIPALPAGSALDLFIDSGRTVLGGVLTQWEDVAHAIIFTPPAGFTGPAVTPTKFQAFDGQLWSLATNELSNVATTLFTAGEACTMAVSGLLTDAGGAISTAFRVGSGVGLTRDFIGNTTFCYSDSITNITNPQMYTGAPFVLVYMITPGTGTMALRLNGWSVVYPYAMAAPAGTPAIDAGASGIQIGNRDDDPLLFWHGYEEEVHGYARILDAADLKSLETNQAAKLGLVGVNGYVSDSAVVAFLGLAGQELVKSIYAATRFYTTATSVTLLVQQNTTAGPGVTNLPMLTIFVDGALFATYTVPTSITPFPPNTTVLALDGHPHIVEIWDGPAEQASPVVPVCAVLIGVQDPTGSTSMLPAVIPENRMVVYGDSISLACGASIPANGAFQELRYLPGHSWLGRVSFFATIGRQLFTDRSFDATFADTSTAIVALAHEVAPGGIKLVWVQISLNDFVASTYASAADWGADLATLVAAIHALDGTVRIVLQGAIVAMNESVPNASGYTLPDLRAQMAIVAAANPTFVSFVDASLTIMGAPPVTLAELNVDGYHPTNAGYATYSTWLIAALQFLGYPTA
jgi:lysophospholipase L1-like esterase